MSKEIDTACQDTIVCPWCGHRVDEGDLFEWKDGIQECEKCEKEMSINAETYVHYWTYKA